MNKICPSVVRLEHNKKNELLIFTVNFILRPFLRCFVFVLYAFLWLNDNKLIFVYRKHWMPGDIIVENIEKMVFFIIGIILFMWTI